LFGSATTTAPVNGRHRLLVALDDHSIDLFVYYCSGAKLLVSASPQYRMVELPQGLEVGPEYGLTVSQKATPAAADFAMYLLSPEGQGTLKSFGFIPVTLPAER
jgi:molybdate transport system substrate-binding protein